MIKLKINLEHFKRIKNLYNKIILKIHQKQL